MEPEPPFFSPAGAGVRQQNGLRINGQVSGSQGIRQGPERLRREQQLMFATWRFQLREAEQAFKEGRLEDAGELLKGDLQNYLPGKRMLSQVARRLATRGKERILAGESTEGWQDFEAARKLGGETEFWLGTKRDLMLWGAGHVENELMSNRWAGAIRRVEDLENRGLKSDRIREYREIALHMQSGENLARRGRFQDACGQVRQASGLRPDTPYIDELLERYSKSAEQLKSLNDHLQRAMLDQKWTDAITHADEILQLAPEHPFAKESRKQAWKVAQRKNDSATVRETAPYVGAQAAAEAQATLVQKKPGESDRFILWVDGVGGYLCCMNDEVTLGQVNPINSADVPIQADLSRIHARIRRTGDGYVFDPIGRVAINGHQIIDTVPLSHGDRIELGRGIELSFQKPHALSATARLDMVSRHRTQPGVDGVLLLAESCVLGARQQNHVVCHDWANDVVLFRQDGELFCRTMESVEIDGELCEGRGKLHSNSLIAGSDFSMSLEEI